MTPTPKLELDPDWEMRTITSSHPRPPRAILCDGVVVGYWHEPRDGFGKPVVLAVSGDIEIQWVLDEFAGERRAARDRAREAQWAAHRAEADAQSERKRRAARKALGLDGQGERRERK